MIVKRNTVGFVTGAVLAFALLTAANARAAWLRAASSACDVVSDGNWVHVTNNTIGSNDNLVGRMSSDSATRGLKAYCPVIDTSSAPVSDGNSYTHATALGYTANSGTAFQAQLCTDFQSNLGGVCDNAGSAPLGAGNKAVDLAISTAWQGMGNSDQLHYIYIFAPTTGSGLSYVSGYSLW